MKMAVSHSVDVCTYHAPTQCVLIVSVVGFTWAI